MINSTKYDILVVEDDPRHIEAAYVLLAGHNLTVVADFASAVDSLSGKKVLLTDLMFPSALERLIQSER